MIFLSIIVPCYRNKDILKMGIPSLERQSIKDFELILIDDKSPNDLYESMEQYVNSDSCSIKDKIRLYKNEINMGPGATRNRGIELARGKYILFLDDDDYLKDDAVEILKENDSDKDVVLYDFERILGKKIINYTCLPKSYGEGMSEKDLVSKVIPTKDALELANFSMCSKMYRREFLLEKGIRMPDLLLGEDYVFTKLALANCESVSYVPRPIYVIQDSRDSLTKINPLGEFADEQYDYIEANWPDKQYDEVLAGIFIYLKCFAKVWNLVEHGKDNQYICDYIESLTKYNINWGENDYTYKMPRYQRLFVRAVEKKKIYILRLIAEMRRIAKKVYR